VLADVRSTGADRFLLGGDFGAFGPWPQETLARLRELEDATWIRGNGERWLLEPPPDRPEAHEMLELARQELGEAEVRWLYALPPQAEIDGVLYVHGSPLSDVESFAREPEEGEERLLAGEHDRTIVFGHSHLQFRRPGPSGTDLVNPGSAGMPLDGDPRAAWALVRDGDFEFRRVEYDVERVAAAWRELGGEFGEFAARRILRGSD
jgi:diadenosine tetraphosphatase ApaH/serine/threonine PP2A family protein phosphatase